MDEVKRVISYIKSCRDAGIDVTITIDKKRSHLVLNALEKQIPMKPEYEGDGYDDSGNLIYDTWICPRCHKRFELDYDDYRYCPECGQKIDWNSEN